MDDSGLPLFIDPETKSFLERTQKTMHEDRMNMAVLVNRMETLVNRLEESIGKGTK